MVKGLEIRLMMNTVEEQHVYKLLEKKLVERKEAEERVRQCRAERTEISAALAGVRKFPPLSNWRARVGDVN